MYLKNVEFEEKHGCPKLVQLFEIMYVSVCVCVYIKSWCNAREESLNIKIWPSFFFICGIHPLWQDFNMYQPHRWRNDWRARLECGRSWVRSQVGLLFQWASTINIQLIVLVLYKADLIIISLKINLFSPWYSWTIAEWALNNNHSLTQQVSRFKRMCRLYHL